MNRVAQTFVAIAAVAGLIGCSRIESFDEVNTANLRQIEYCELRESPNRYDGKIVRISAQIGNFGHGYYFYDERCNDKVSENLLDDSRTSVRFFEPRASELSDSLGPMTGIGRYQKPTSVVAVGRFTRQYPTTQTDLMSDRTSFHFELFSIEQVPGGSEQ